MMRARHGRKKNLRGYEMSGRTQTSTEIACSGSNCNLKGWWVEEGEHGEPVFCFRTRHHGQKHIVRLTKEQFLAALETKGRGR
jgi:hypothetical protein